MRKICSNCGYTWEFDKLGKVRMLLFNTITHTCPKCLTRTEWVLINHPVKIKTKNIKRMWENA